MGDKFAGIFDERPENTLAGSVIGMAHDLISSPQSQEEKVERAAKHDTAALFVADTVAIVPQLKMTTAGLARAALLFDPHSGFSGNALNFGKNFAEGAALNGVGRLAGASGQRLTQSYLGRGLMAESVTHLSVGFGFGAVKSGFDAKSWHNSQGEFSVGSGAASILKGGTIGAAFNLPAGYIGLRAAKGTVALMGENASMRATNVVAGTVSGYAGGAVFGGIDSVMHGKSLSETIDNIHMAGTAGALTGGFISGFDHSRNTQGIFKYISPEAVPVRTSRASSLELTPGSANRSLTREFSFSAIDGDGSLPGTRSDTQRKTRTERSERKMFEKTRPDDSFDGDAGFGTRGKKGLEQGDTIGGDKKAEGPSFKDKDFYELSEVLDYDAPLVPRPGDYAGRLRRPRVETQQVTHLDPAYKGKIRDFTDFANNSVVKDHKMRVLDIEGHTAVLKIEEGYAQRQDAVIRDLSRLQRQAEQKVPYDALSRDDRMQIGQLWKSTNDPVELLSGYMSRDDALRSIPVIEARNKIMKGDHQSVVLPHEFIALLDALPNRTLVKSLTIFDGQDPMNPYLKVKYDNPDFMGAASADPSGNITFYLPPEKSVSRATLREHMNHEWAHLLDFRNPKDHDLFALAALVDKDVTPERTNSASSGAKPAEVASEAGKSMTTGTVQKKLEVFSTDKPDANATKHGVDPDRQPEGKFYVSDYSQKNRLENWAVHLGEEGMAPSIDGLVYMGEEMPVRTVILMRALGKSIEQSAAGTGGTLNSTFARRVAYTDEVVLPSALEILVGRIKTGTPAEKAASAELLGHLGTIDSHTPILRKLAIDSESHLMPEGVPEATHRPYKGLGGPDVPREVAPKERRTISDIAFDSALRLREGNPQAQIDFLIEQGRPGSPTQDLALVRLEELPGGVGYAYAKFLRMAGNPDKTPDLIRMMSEMPDRKGSELVFDEALRLGEGGEGAAGYKKSLVYRALEIPVLRQRALGMVQPYLQDPVMVSTLGRLSRQQWDKDVSSKATMLLNKARSEATVDSALELLRSKTAEQVELGVQQASKVHDHRLIEPLLRVYLNGPESSRASAAVALQGYQPQMVKFYLRGSRETLNADANLINKLFSGVRVSYTVESITDNRFAR